MCAKSPMTGVLKRNLVNCRRRGGETPKETLNKRHALLAIVMDEQVHFDDDVTPRQNESGAVRARARLSRHLTGSPGHHR